MASESGDRHVGSAGWGSPLVSPIRYFNLPAATRAVFNLALRDGTALGWAGVNLFTPEQARWRGEKEEATCPHGPSPPPPLQVLRTGTVALRLWPGAFDPGRASHATCLSNPALDGSVVTLSVTLPAFERTVVRGGVRPLRSALRLAAAGVTPDGVVLSDEADELASGYTSQRASAAEFAAQHSAVRHVISRDPLHRLRPEEARLVWLCRERLVGLPAALPKLLHATRWDDAASVDEAHRLLVHWRPPSPLQALELLQARRRAPQPAAPGVPALH